jgi:cytoskeletal protein CcmA (bactofilin family)
MSEPVRSPISGLAPAAIIGPQTRFSGLIQLREPARIDGEIDGEIFATETVWIGETGRVHASIEAPEVVVAGELEGDIVASRRVELTATARVTGSIECPILALAEGGNLEGRCAIGGSPPEPDPMP